MKRKRIIALFLLCVMCASIIFTSGCSKKEQSSKEPGQEKEEKKQLEETEFKLVENGNSLYKIVVPEQTDERIKWASEELQTFLTKSTGAILEIITESQVTSNENVISLGHTSVAAALDAEAVKAEDLGVSGYIMKTVGNSLIILADAKQPDCEGVMYGVYDFLVDAIGFEAYAADEIVYDEKETIPLYAYDEKVKPDFDIRQECFKYIDRNRAHARRLRITAEQHWYKVGLNGHSQVSQVLKYNTYGEQHPDWYSAGGMQLCWSAGAEMEAEFAKNLIEIIQDHPDDIYFHLYQEDQLGYCVCDKCKANIKTYGNYAGLQIVWANKVYDLVEEWRVKNAPEREIKLVLCTYMSTYDAPVKKGSDGKYVAIHKDCVPREGLYFNYSPIEADFSQPLNSPTNKMHYETLVQWTDLAPGKILTYMYTTNYRWGMLPFNNFNAVQNYFQELHKHGVTEVFSEGTHIMQPCFSEMRIFIESKLQWDVDCATYDELVDEFMKAYYQDAAPAMRKYYDYILKNYEECDSVISGAVYANLSSTDVFTKDDIDTMIGYMEEALEAIEPMRNTQNEHFAKLYMRVKKDFLTVIYCQLHLYNLYYTPQELNDLAIEFNYICDYFEIVNMGESGGRVAGAFDMYLLDVE